MKPNCHFRESGNPAPVEHLLTHFDRIADTPNAIPRLRRFILDLAVRGKLVSQDSNDEPASELLKRIAAEKKRKMAAGEIKKEKLLPEIALDEIPFDTPHNWEWIRLGSSAIIVQGFAFSSGNFSNDPNTGYPLIKIGDIGTNTPTVFLRGPYDLAFVVNRGDILVGLSGSIKCAIWEGPTALLNQRIARITPASNDLLSVWLLFGVNTRIEKWKDETAKMTVQNVKAHQLYESLIPLPPLAEQHRIVAKVDEFMALCEQLEETRAKREATRDRMATASLARLNEPDPDPATFQNHARFALNNLTPLTTRPDQIKALRQTILNLAVRGKLVPQDPNDEPASELLKRIAAEKDRLVKTGEIPRAKSTVRGLNEKFARQLPQNWSKTSISQIAYLRSGIALKHGEEQAVGDLPYLKVSDLSLTENDKGIVTSSRFVGHDLKDAVIESGSIVFPKRGGAIATNRKRRLHVNIVCDSNIMAMKPFVNDLLPFLELWFSNLDLWKLNSGTSVPQINNKDIYPLSIHLPPLAEQHRIVAKVDELMTLCNRLEASLVTGDEARGRLIESMLHEALVLDSEEPARGEKKRD